MNSFHETIPPDPKRFYRNQDEKVIAGVCAGLADYFGWDRTVVRLATVGLSLVGFAGPILLGYIVLWMVLPKRPHMLFQNRSEETFWQSVNARPHGTVADLARKFRDLDVRLAKMERRVTTPDFDLDRKFRDLGA